MRRRDFVARASAAMAAALAACSQPQQKQEGAPATGPDPAAVIRPLYDRYMTQGATFPSFANQAPWSGELWSQLEAMNQRSEALNEPILDFDPLIGAQDYQLSNLSVTTESLVPQSHAVVRAAFTNIDQHTEIVYDLVWANDSWRVDNIRGDGWDLRQIAAAPNADAIPTAHSP